MTAQLLDFEGKQMLPVDHMRRELFEVPTDNEGHTIHLTRGEIQMIQKYELPAIDDKWIGLLGEKVHMDVLNEILNAQGYTTITKKEN